MIMSPALASSIKMDHQAHFSSIKNKWKNANHDSKHRSNCKYAPVPVAQFDTTDAMVLRSEPTTIVVHSPVSDHFLTLSVVLTVICFILGTWFSLLCTVPAVICSTMARKAEAHGNVNDAQNKAQISLLLNITALIWWIIAFVIIVLSVAVVVAGGASGSQCHIDQNYNSYDCSK